MKMSNETIKVFCKATGITEAQAHGENIGGDFYAGSLTTIPEGVTLNIGGYFYANSLTTKYERIAFVNEWNNGTHVHADGILCEVVSHRENVYRVRRIGRENVQYLVTDGNGKWSHGSTLAEAKADLLYKLSERNADQFKGIDRDKKLSFSEAIGMYRTITGACSAGCRGFVEQNGLSTRKKYSVNEVLKITKGAFGNDQLVQFFAQKDHQ